eukprot:6208039-Pleurochrysis_carterae.AAC.4
MNDARVEKDESHAGKARAARKDTHRRTHAHARARTRTHRHTHARSHTRTLTHSHAHDQARTHTHSSTHMRAHAREDASSPSRTIHKYRLVLLFSRSRRLRLSPCSPTPRLIFHLFPSVAPIMRCSSAQALHFSLSSPLHRPFCASLSLSSLLSPIAMGIFRQSWFAQVKGGERACACACERLLACVDVPPLLSTRGCVKRVRAKAECLTRSLVKEKVSCAHRPGTGASFCA